MNKIYWIVLVVIVFCACKNENFSIEGRITNSLESKIYLEKLNINGTVAFDSAKVDKNGDFKIKGSVSYPTFFLLKLNNQKFITLLVDSTENIKFSADYLNFSKDYKVEGSLGSQKVKQLNDKLACTNTKIDSLQSLINLLYLNDENKSKKELLISEIQEVYKTQQSFSKAFVEQNPFSMASVLAIYQKFNNGNYVMQDIHTLKMAASALNSMYPNSVHSQTLYKDTEKLIKDIKAVEMKQFIEQYGSNTPEIKLPDVNGKSIALSEVKSKYVLVHFWSALDPTSRMINEILVENYKQFNKKGFEIYQVSVDTDKEAWLTAVEDDHLKWINVGDMEGSISAVNSYNISRIPYNYLLDREGNIIAKDLKGPALHNALSKILN